jgi:hypothetical protein
MTPEIYNNNMRALLKYYPQYYQLVKNAKENPDYELRKTKVHLPTLYIKSKDAYIYDKDNPVQECGDNLKSFDIHHARMGIFFGFGLGYDMLFYTERVSQQVSTEQVLVIEKDPAMFKLAMKTVNLVPMFEQPRITILLGHSVDELFNLMTKWINKDQKYFLLRAARYFYNMHHFEIEQDYYAGAMDAFRRAAVYVTMYWGNDAKDSLIGVQNMFANLDEIINNPGINMLKNKFKGMPAVCVATGPSLDKNIHLLKGLEDKALIIAADASLKPMLNRGLKPHLVSTLEREMAVVELFKDIPGEQYDDVYLCGCPVIYPEVYQEYKGPRIIVYRMFDHFKWLGVERGLLEIKLSAGNMNFKIAEYLGCNPIILIGQDLALIGEQSNATGAALGSEQQSYLAEPRLKVKGNYADEVVTTRSLNMYLEAYQVDVADYKGKCINATEGGAYIHGTHVITFSEAITKHLQQKRDIKGILNKELGKFKPSENEKAMVRANVNRSLESFRITLKACEEALDWLDAESEKLASEQTKEYLDEKFQKMLQYKIRMQHDHYTWQLFFAHIAQSVFVNHDMYINSIPMDIPDLLKARTKSILESKQYFELIGGLIKVCIEDLEGVKI